jgi:hypothetical protein
MMSLDTTGGYIAPHRSSQAKETKLKPNNAGLTEAASLKVTREAAESETTVARGAGGWFRSRLGTGWRFARHLLEMVLAMFAGMAALGLAIAILGEPPGYANRLVEYGLMGASMSVPMVLWMRYRGHSWADGVEMMVAMLAPMFALVLPVELGLAGAAGDSLMMLSHVAMIGGMVALMVYRWDRYARGHRE